MAEQERHQFYDPYRLVEEIQFLLREQGLNPRAIPGEPGLSVTGAGMLLRGLGITPGVEMLDGLANTMDRLWPDRDEREP
jgi:hypothetical protein